MAEPKQDRAVQTRKDILLAAAEMFDEFGYAGASISKIINRAGVTQGAMYFHFKSKEELARAVMNSQPETIVPYVDSVGLQRLVDTTLVWCHQLQSGPLLRAGVRLASEQDAMGVHDSTSFENWAELLIGYLEEARKRGELRAGVDVHETAEFLVSACTGMQVQSAVVSGRQRTDLSRRVSAMWRVLLPALATEEAAVAVEVDIDKRPSILGRVLGAA